MKESTLEMAWNEPKDRNNTGGEQEKPRGQDQKPKQEEMPDLDVLLKDLKNKVLGKSTQNGGNGNNGGNQKRTPNIPFKGGLNGKVLGFGAIGAFILWMLTGIYIVDTGTNAVVLFLGKEQAVTGPGMHWRFPSPVAEHRIINVENRFSATIGGRNNETMMLTKDEAIVDVRVEVQYEIDRANPASYWFASTKPDEILRDVVESAVRERVGQTSLDAILTSGRAQLVIEVKILAQEVLNSYGIGLNITNVNLVDAQAPKLVQAAFTDAIKAREDEQRMINQANTYVTDILARINGEVQRELAKAEGYKQSVIAKAEGEANRFELLNKAYAQAPSITRQRLYLDAMENIFKDTNKVLMNTSSNNNLMVLPLDQLLQGKSNVDSAKTQSSNGMMPLQKSSALMNSVTPKPVMSQNSLSQQETAQERAIRSRRDGR